MRGEGEVVKRQLNVKVLGQFGPHQCLDILSKRVHSIGATVGRKDQNAQSALSHPGESEPRCMEFDGHQHGSARPLLTGH